MKSADWPKCRQQAEPKSRTLKRKQKTFQKPLTKRGKIVYTISCRRAKEPAIKAAEKRLKKDLKNFGKGVDKSRKVDVYYLLSETPKSKIDLRAVG